MLKTLTFTAITLNLSNAKQLVEGRNLAAVEPAECASRFIDFAAAIQGTADATTAKLEAEASTIAAN